MKSKAIGLAIILLSISGCAGSKLATRKNAQISQDKFSKQTKILGVTKKKTQKHGMLSLNPVSYYWFLRSWKSNGNSAVRNQLYVRATYLGDWKFFNRASFKGGKSAKIQSIDQKVNTCTSVVCAETEIFGIVIPNSFLLSHKNGFPIKIYAKSGDQFILHVTGHQVISQLAKIEQ